MSERRKHMDCDYNKCLLGDEAPCIAFDPHAIADDHPQGMLISDYEHPVDGYSFSRAGEVPDFKRMLSVEFTVMDVDPAVLGILTGGVLGDKPEPTFAMEIHHPIKRTFWQWLRRKPRLWNHYYIPNAQMESETDE